MTEEETRSDKRKGVYQVDPADAPAKRQSSQHRHERSFSHRDGFGVQDSMSEEKPHIGYDVEKVVTVHKDVGVLLRPVLPQRDPG